MASNANTDIDKLIAFGQMALEQGWYDKAREYFEQAIALDASNIEAKKALHQIDGLLECRRAVADVPVRVRVQTGPSRAKSIWLRVNFALEWIRKKRKERADRIAEKKRLDAERREKWAEEYERRREARAKELARQREEQERELARQREEKARQIAELKQAWAEQRAQRGNVPLQLGQCPECGSVDSDKYKDVSGGGCLAMALTFPVSLLVYPLLPDTYRCNVCGARWKG